MTTNGKSVKVILGQCILGESEYRLKEVTSSYEYQGKETIYHVLTLESKRTGEDWAKVDATYMSPLIYMQIMAIMLKVHLHPNG